MSAWQFSQNLIISNDGFYEEEETVLRCEFGKGTPD